MRLRLIAILAVGVGGCEQSTPEDELRPPPPPPPASGIDIATYHSAVHARLCELLAECCTPTEALFIESCEDRSAWYEDQARFQGELVAMGRARWDGDAAESCVANFDAMTCDDLVRRDYFLDRCAGALVFLESPPQPCADYPCEAGSWCLPNGDTYICRPDRAEGAICSDAPAACGDLQRCQRPVLTNDRICRPSLCDGDTANDARTVVTEFYQGTSGDGHTMTAECTLPPDGFFECACVIDGVASVCKSDRRFRLDVDFGAYICC